MTESHINKCSPNKKKSQLSYAILFTYIHTYMHLCHNTLLQLNVKFGNIISNPQFLTHFLNTMNIGNYGIHSLVTVLLL